MQDYNSFHKKFNGDDLTIKDYKYWSLILRDNQITLGACVLVIKNSKYSFSDLNNEEILEMNFIFKEIETSLKNVFHYDKINYLALMMIDPLFHFHIIPRFKEKLFFNENEYEDTDYPNPPNLTSNKLISKNTKKKIIKEITKWL